MINPTPITPEIAERETRWRRQVLLIGVVVGALFGYASAYLYSRAAEEDTSGQGYLKRVSTGELLSIGIAAVAMIRQIAEMGRGDRNNRRRR